MEYRLATHIGSGVVRHVIESDRLVVVHEKNAKRVEIPFSEIRALNLRQELPGAFTMRIERASGGAIAVPSRHFVAAGRFEHRDGEYVAFVRRLHEAVAAASPSARFVAGSSGLYWLGWLFVTFGAVLAAFLLWALVSADREMPRRALFAVVPLALVVGGAFIRQGRATPYAPSAPPERLLPQPQ